MKYLLLAAGLLLASCTTPKPPTTAPPLAAPVGSDTLTPDSTRAYTPAAAPVQLTLHAADSGYTPQQVVRRRLFGLLPPKKAASSPAKTASNQLALVPRKCKGCTFNLVAGNQTNAVVGKKATAATAEGATASVIEKKAGPAIVASDSASANSVAGPGNLQATNGNNNAPTLTALVHQPPDWRATLARPVGYALAGVGTVLVVGAVLLLIVAYQRRHQLPV